MNNVSVNRKSRHYTVRWLPVLVGLFMSTGLKAQNFNYSFSKDSVAYQELNSQTILNTNNGSWRFSYEVPIGFHFNFLGREFDSLRIETNGYLVFDNDRHYAMSSFIGFMDCLDSSGNHSVLGYNMSGTSDNHILKIQFKNISNSPNSDKHFSYQIWLKENGNVEFHIGPNDFQARIEVTTTTIDSMTVARDTNYVNMDSLQIYRVGFLNMNMDAATNGLFVGGTVSSPQSQPVNENNPEPSYLYRAPTPGTRYTFTPISN